jgi:predicted nucleotidyltransferase
VKDRWIQRFKKEVLPVLLSEFEPETVIIFGSRITGNATEDSDIDVVLAAESFKEIPFIKRMPMVLRRARFDKHVDYICYTPREFQNLKNKSSLLMDALENGEKVA